MTDAVLDGDPVMGFVLAIALFVVLTLLVCIPWGRK